MLLFIGLSKRFILDGHFFVFVDFHLESSFFVQDSDQFSSKVLIFFFEVDFRMTGSEVFAGRERFKALLALVSVERLVDRVVAFYFLFRLFFGPKFLIDSSDH